MGTRHDGGLSVRPRWPGSSPPASGGCELGVISDRGRIARDLHDHVIQRLAVGLSLQGAIPGPRCPRSRRDSPIPSTNSRTSFREIRTTIFDLRRSSGTTAATAHQRGGVGVLRVGTTGPPSHSSTRCRVVDATFADHAKPRLLRGAGECGAAFARQDADRHRPGGGRTEPWRSPTTAAGCRPTSPPVA